MTDVREIVSIVRHPLGWEDPDFYDENLLDQETRRVFDICHGCRRCFNLCDSFPRLFDLVDATDSGEVHDVSSKDFGSVVDACTLCDMCFVAKCPYVPPHEFNLDFPHLMLRHRAVQFQKKQTSFPAKQLAKTDRNGSILAQPVAAPLANWATSLHNKPTRYMMEKTCGIDRKAALPEFCSSTLLKRTKNTKQTPPINQAGPGFGDKVILFATCFVNYNNPDIGEAALWVLTHNGVEAQVTYPGCCAMPHLEQGDLESVAQAARKTSAALVPWIESGHKVIALIPSCALMLKTEWPLLLPQDESVKMLAQNTLDLSEYLAQLSKKGEHGGLAPPTQPLEGGITLHIPCHARAQNIGRPAEALLKQLPETEVHVIERCSGHGGTWGICKSNFDTALKIGKPVAEKAISYKDSYIVSECPLACTHIQQGMEMKMGASAEAIFAHPVQLLAYAYGYSPKKEQE